VHTGASSPSCPFTGNIVFPRSKNILARAKIAEGYISDEKYEDASKIIEKIIEINPKSHEGMFLKGRLHLVKGEFDDAIAFLQPYLKDNPNVPMGHYLLGLGHLGNKDIQQAKTEPVEAVKLNPQWNEARLTLAQTAKEQVREDFHIADTLGWVYYKKNVFSRAIVYLKEANEKISDNPVIRYLLGMAYFKNGDK
jgi:tetratricopeptide (TPR) repeat protein